MKTTICQAENISHPQSKKREQFPLLVLQGIDPSVVKNPVIKMLMTGDAVLASGRRCSIIPEDEMLIFLD